MIVKFSGKVVLVAGGTGGLGHAVSLAFLSEGAKVVVTYRNQKEFDALRSAAGTNGSSLEGRRVDVTDEAAVRELIDAVFAKYGRLDGLVNTVGGYAGGVNLWGTDPKLFDQMLTVNMRSGYVLARATVPAMVKQGFGAIVNIASKAAVDHAAGAAAYCFESGRGGNDGFARRRGQGHRGAGELDSSQHYRYGNKPESNPQS